MTWENLNNSELQALRKLLMLDVSEAAEIVGKVTNRTWQYWESGRSNVPVDVLDEMLNLIEQRNQHIDKLSKWQLDNPNDHLRMPYYHTFEQYQADHPDKNKACWRVHQAAVALIFSEGGNVELY